MIVDRFSYTKGYTAGTKVTAENNIAHHQSELRDVLAGMLHYGTKDEILSWVADEYDSVLDAYNDWLSVQ